MHRRSERQRMRETKARNRVRIRSLSVPSPLADRRFVAESHYASLGPSARFTESEISAHGAKISGSLLSR